MKTKLHFKLAFLATLAAILLISCNNDSSITDDGRVFDETSAQKQTEIDIISEGINDLVEDTFYEEQDGVSSKSTYEKGQTEDDCRTVTKVKTDTSKEITIDFGDGCTTKDDDIVSGKIVMLYSYDISDLSVTIDYTFENFYFNSKKIEGSVQKIKIKKNDAGNFQATVNRNVKILWEDGSFMTVEGERTREWVEGFNNKDRNDNVFLITGNWTVTNMDGSTKTVKIIEPLRRELSCKFIVSGKTEINKGDKLLTLDYGNGDCDNKATVSFKDKEREIILKKK